ncbi:MAG: hypothetical protein PVF93_09725 [Chromatiaceae bacterium]
MTSRVGHELLNIQQALQHTFISTGGAKVVFGTLLQQIFYSLGRHDAGLDDIGSGSGFCRGGLADAVEHVVDGLDGRLRMMPKYRLVLSEPVANFLRYIDELGETIPGPVLCSRSAFATDTYTNAFFASPQHAQEIFSQSEEVRRLFDESAITEYCWALLCMTVERKTHPALALVGDEVRADVMQTTISFSDHQIVSPGADEAAARCALKCCMFDAYLSHIRREMVAAKTSRLALQSRIQALRARQRRLSRETPSTTDAVTLQHEIHELERQYLGEGKRVDSISGRLDFVARKLSQPDQFISSERCFLRVNRQAAKLEPGSEENDTDLKLSKIHIASHQTRVGALVQFPRAELLPKPDMLKQADLFLAV